MSTVNAELTDNDKAERDALAERMFKSALEALELLHVYLGDRLGLYRALAAGGPLTSHGLAAAAAINERYAREWLEQQAVSGILTVEPGADGADGRRYSLPPGHAEVMLDVDSLNFLAPMSRGIVGIAAVMPDVIEAFRTGGGVPYEKYGPDVRSSISGLNRPMFINQLGTEWIPVITHVDGRLRSEPPARVADVGCGTGWSSIAIAKAYPTVKVDGFDLDVSSIEEARRNAVGAGVGDRVTFEVHDAADPSLAASYDLATAFETIHDMANPVGAMRAMRGLVKRGGAVLIGDERVAEEFTAPGDERERFMYGWSAVHCLAVGMVDANSAATGTVMRPSQLLKYALEAGFTKMEILPIENENWRFYLLSG